jgi:hypothetical protein
MSVNSVIGQGRSGNDHPLICRLRSDVDLDANRYLPV